MSAPSGNLQLPPIQSSQFASGSTPGANAQGGVNLFRGDVNLTIDLISLPARPGRSSLNLSVSILYMSNVQQAVTRRNLEAPTSCLGLGWELPRTRIALADPSALSASQRQYLYIQGEQQTQLVPDGRVWPLFSLPASLQPDLGGSQVTAALCAAFSAQGIGLDAQASISSVDATHWLIDDAVKEHQYAVAQADDGSLAVSEGGVSFQLQDYDFSRILYFPSYERWERTDRDGLTQVFGGGLGTRSGVNTSQGNSVEWGVCWLNQGTPAWVGASSVTAGQAQYALAWNLYSIGDRWGDTVLYGYNEFSLTQDGLLEGAEQRVGYGSTDGLPFTRQCLLTSLTDVFRSKTIRFVYLPKQFASLDNPAGAREFNDPHKSLVAAADPKQPPTNLTTPNSYQDTYETMYLDHITVAEGDAPPTRTIVFGYYPLASKWTDPTSPLSGDMAKRYLESITWFNADGEALPGYRFSYATESADAVNFGAMTTMTSPSGAVTTYTYQAQTLPICNRSITVTAPTSTTSTFTPRVWFGPDYAVVIWYESEGVSLRLTVYTWTGTWQAWEPPSPLFSSAAGGAVLESLNVLPGPDFFAVSFVSPSGVELFRYSRDPARFGAWLLPPGAGGVVNSNPEAPVQFFAGSNFVLTQTRTQEGYALSCSTWQWAARQWSSTDISFTTPPRDLFVLTNDEYFVLVTDSGGLELYWVDSLGTLHAAGSTTIPNYQPTVQSADNWAVGDSMVAGAIVRSQETGFEAFDLVILQWDAEYNLYPLYTLPDCKQDLPSDGGWSFTPAIVDNALVICSGFSVRFYGSGWVANSSLAVARPFSPTQYWFAAGVDFLMRTCNGGNSITCQMLVYDPDRDLDTWTPSLITPAPQPQPNPPHAQNAWYPTAWGADYFASGTQLYYRGSSTDWVTPAASPIVDLATLSGSSAEVETTGMVNQAPSFLVYPIYKQDSQETYVNAAFVTNGTQVSFAQLDNDQSITSSGQVAGPLVGLNAFVTYAGDAGFDSVTSFTLYRYAAQSFQDPLTDYTVETMTVDDGFGRLSPTFYEFQAATAACDPTGTVVKYYQSASYPGASSLETAVNGRVVSTFVNAVVPSSVYTSFLDGSPQQQLVFAGSFVFRAPYDASTGLMQVTQQQAPVSAGLVSWFNAQGAGTLDSTAMIGYVAEGNYWQITTSSATYTMAPDSPLATPGATLTCMTGYLQKSQAATYIVYDQVNSNPATPDAGPVPYLLGAFSVTAGTVNVMDGVATRSENFYIPDGLALPFSGLPVGMRTDSYNGTGQQESWLTTSTYGYDVYPALLTANLLSPVVQTTTAVVVGTTRTPLQAQATTWQAWMVKGASGLSRQVYGTLASWSWLGGGSPQFPFAGGDTSSWLSNSVITARDSVGLVTEQLDGLGVPTSTIFDTGQQYRVAVFTNASVTGEEALYCGFEAIEDSSAWTVSGATVITSDAHTGEACLSLPGGGTASLSATLTPKRQDQPYLFACWYKTAPGYTGGPGSGWTITVGSGAPLVVPFADTQGAWSFLSVVVQPGPEGSAIVLSAGNADAAQVLIDDVHFSPLCSDVTANTYDTTYNKLTATVGLGPHTARMVYDRFQRKLAQVGPAENVTQLTYAYVSGQGTEQGFQPAEPNSLLTVVASEGGVYESFLDGSGWQADWTASNAGTNWTPQDGCLVHGTASSDTLAAATVADSGFALYFELTPGSPDQPAAGLTDTFGITTGDALALTWQASSGQWSLQLSGAPVQPIPSAAPLARDWLLVVTSAAMQFYGDGMLIFSAVLTEPLSSPPVITTGANVLTLHNLMRLDGPRMTREFRDANGRSCQQQQLVGGDALVSQMIYDLTGQAIVQTKVGPALFGSGATLPLMAYRPGFIDVDAFLASMSSTGSAVGDLADYYAGQDGRSNDQGYPFTRKRFEPAPSGRVIEQGKPGLAYAIANLDTTTPAQRSTTKYVYSANTAAPFGPALPLPAGQYAVTTTIDALGQYSFTLKDKRGQTVAAATATTPGAPTAATTYRLSSTQPSYNAIGVLTTTLTPNSFTPPPCVPIGQYVSQTQTNTLGQTTSRSSADTGTTQYLYDQAGRLRFSQDSQLAALGLIAYVKYDALGRRIEAGTVAYDWTPATAAQLQSCAFDPAWPDGTNSPAPTVGRRVTYGGIEGGPNDLGLAIQIDTPNPASSPVTAVTERYTRDARGAINQYVLQLTPSSGDPSSYTIGYVTNNVGEVVQVDYPCADLTGVGTVTYGFNEVGAITQIGTPDDATAYGSYAYDVSGNMITKTLGAAGSTVFTYDSCSRLASHATTTASGAPAAVSFSETFSFTALSTIHAMSEQASGFPGAPSFGQSFTYDTSSQLASVTSSEQPTLNAGYGYDANGNLNGVNPGTPAQTYQYAPGVNQMSGVTQTDGGSVAFAYLPNGYVYTAARTAAGGGTTSLVFSYDPQRRLTTGATDAARGTTVTYCYDSDGRRAVKQWSTQGVAQQRTYVYGTSPRPLLQLASDGTAVAFLQGPDGLLAYSNGQVSFLVLDQIGSPRLVLGGDGTFVAGYDYLPFGALANTYGTPSPALQYLFAGKELDPELGLYDFSARLYDPSLGRFYATDPARQFASPYLYAGNNPLTLSDPTGMVTTAQRVGVGIGFGVMALFGLGLGIFTGGADIPVLTLLLGQTFSGIFSSIGSTGLQYATSHSNSDYSANELGKKIGVATLSGAFSGLTLGLGTWGLQTWAAIGAKAESLAEPGEYFKTVTGRADLLPKAQILDPDAGLGQTVNTVLSRYPGKLMADVGTNLFAGALGGAGAMAGEKAFRSLGISGSSFASLLAESAGVGAATGAVSGLVGSWLDYVDLPSSYEPINGGSSPPSPLESAASFKNAVKQRVAAFWKQYSSRILNSAALSSPLLADVYYEDTHSSS